MRCKAPKGTTCRSASTLGGPLQAAGNTFASNKKQNTLSAARPLRPAKEIAAAIEFLLSENAGFITGQTLFVDGGASIGKAAV